jgi:hypothetical protein
MSVYFPIKKGGEATWLIASRPPGKTLAKREEGSSQLAKSQK